jgi:hypothetical protein
VGVEVDDQGLRPVIAAGGGVLFGADLVAGPVVPVAADRGCSATLTMPMSRAVSGADNSNAASRRPRAGWGGTVPMARSPI